MTALRWGLGIVSVLAAAGWIGFATLLSRFRESFGASAVGRLKLLGPPAGFALVTLSVLVPEFRLLLHATGVLFVGTAVGSLFLLKKAPFVAVTGILYSVLWFAFYASEVHLGR